MGGGERSSAGPACSWPPLGIPKLKLTPSWLKPELRVAKGEKEGEEKPSPWSAGRGARDKQGQLQPRNQIRQFQSCGRMFAQLPGAGSGALLPRLAPPAPVLPPGCLPSSPLSSILGPGILEGPASKDLKTTHGDPHYQQGPREGMSRVGEQVDPRGRGGALEPQTRPFPQQNERMSGRGGGLDTGILASQDPVILRGLGDTQCSLSGGNLSPVSMTQEDISL